jgi:hypothetical protein
VISAGEYAAGYGAAQPAGYGVPVGYGGYGGYDTVYLFCAEESRELFLL